MNKHLLMLTLLILLTVTHYALSQIVVTYPTERAIFQRDNANEADVYIGGFVEQPYQKIEVRLLPRVTGEGETFPADGGWAVLDDQIVAGQFYGSVHLKGGWYQLEARGVSNGSISPIRTLSRVGVGEVFVVAGQSNATGGDSNPNGPGATHDQVNSVNFQNVNPATFSVTPYPNIQLPCPEFVHLDAGVKTAPFGNYAWCWGSFGDKIYEKLHVPVMIFNAGWSSTGIDNWKQTTDPNGVTTSAFGYVFPTGLPFGHLRLALNNYIAQLGVRAVLWHQGETDNYLEQPGDGTYNRYLTGLWDVISASRNLTGKHNLGWVVARASRFTVNGSTRISTNVVNAQNELINNDGLYPYVFQGPDTDPYFSLAYRHDEIHFRGDGVTPSPDGQIYSGLIHLAGFWADKITPDFLTQSQPYPGTPPPAVDAAYSAGGSQVTFTGPNLAAGAQYNWLNFGDCNQVQSTAQQWTVGSGLYRLKIIDSYQNTVLSPTLNVSAIPLPVTWQSFTAKMGSNGRITLNWSTANERNADHFEVQRSTDSKRFETIGIVTAVGNASRSSVYWYEDEILPKGIYYYRLKQLDVDGKSDITRIVGIRVEGNELVRLFPNPAQDVVVIQSGNALNQVRIYNPAGKLVRSADTNERIIRLNIHDLPSGLYVVTVDGKDFKIVK